MARPLRTALMILPVQKVWFMPAAPIAFLMIFAVFSVVTFLCGSHSGLARSLRGKERKRTVRLGGDGRNKPRMMARMKSGLSSKALLMARMISWRKVQDEDETEDCGYFVEEGDDDDDDDDIVWKKAIIRGEKCRPIDFSGKILYDCDGNRLPD